MKKFVHIGYPKNFSTSLQYDFFAKHPQLFHLGIGPELAYADALTEAAFEVYLKSAKGLKYAEAEPRLLEHFEMLYKKAAAQGKKAVSISSEHLSFAFSNDSIGLEEKIARLSRLTGPDTHILAVIRNQSDLIKSLYRESVRVGFPGDYSKYMYLLYKYQDRNFYYDLRYDLMYEVLCKYFKRANIHFVIFEDLRVNGELVRENGKLRLVNMLCEAMGIDYLEANFGHYNEALEDAVVLNKAKLNETQRHDLGNILYDTAEKHRMKHYLSQELDLQEPEEELYGDVRIKRALIAEARNSGGNAGEKINYEMRADIAQRMKHFYEEGNRNFVQKTQMQLPAAYANLDFGKPL